MSKMNQLNIATSLANKIDRLKDCDVVGAMYRTSIPETYLEVETLIVENYRVTIYDMNLIGKASYLVDIAFVGQFQMM